jgi:hypothetical protein
MRRAEKEVVDRVAMDTILASARILFLAIPDEPAPYVLPVCFGIDHDTLYVHSARVGRKIELLQRHPIVGFSACTEMEIIAGDSACDFTSTAQSVIGTGRVRIVEREEERRRGLDSIMRHYAEAILEHPFYRPGSLSRTCVLALEIATMRGKNTGGTLRTTIRPCPIG